MLYLIDGLHEDLNLVKKKKYTETVEANGRSDELVSKLSWERHLVRNRSVLVDLFTGQFKSTVECPTCDKVSVCFDPFNIHLYKFRYSCGPFYNILRSNAVTHFQNSHFSEIC